MIASSEIATTPGEKAKPHEEPGTAPSRSHESKGRPRERAFALGLTVVFFALELVNILHHAMWRDEIQVWSLSQKCQSLLQFLTLKKYEDLGHPDAWHLLVYPVSRFTSNPIAMQLVHLCVATLTAFIVARYAPFSRAQRVLAVFGYFLFYEYATISRGYAFGVLCVFAFCALFRPGPKKNYLALAAVLALMAQANVQALMLSIAFALMLVLEAVRAAKPKKYLYPNTPRVALAAGLFAAGGMVSALRMRPPEDSAFYPPWHFSFAPVDVGRTVAMMWKAFVPIPQLSRQFWNTNIVSNLPLVAALSLAVLAVSMLFFLRKPTILFLYASGIGAMMLFRHVKYAGYLRHDGHAYILFLACAWLACDFPVEKVPFAAMDKLGAWFAPHAKTAFVGLLAVQMLAGIIASAIALRVPFSEGKPTADYLRANHLDNMFIVGDFDAPLATVAGYLGREIYYPRSDRMGTYIVWDNKRMGTLKEPLLDIGKEKAAERHQDVLVIANHPADIDDPSIRELGAFEGSISREDFYIYRVPYLHGNDAVKN